MAYFQPVYWPLLNLIGVLGGSPKSERFARRGWPVFYSKPLLVEKSEDIGSVGH
jgi:hypothetical protein